MKALYLDYITKLKQHNFRGEMSDLLEERELHAYDESIFYIRPELVLYPRDVRDVQIAASLASTLTTPTNSIHLTPRAAGSGLSGGSLNNSVVVNTTRHLTTIHAHRRNGEEVFFEVDPGVYYRDLEKEMDVQGVYIPSFPASKDLCTVGGMVGNNAAGPHSFRFGHTARFVESLDMVLSDGEVYTFAPLTFREFQEVIAGDSSVSQLYRAVWELLREHETLIMKSRPQTRKNSAGYALWDVLSVGVAEFERGQGTINLVPIIVGSQGTLGIITRLVLRAVPKPSRETLLVVPVFDLESVGDVINSIITDDPLAIELFDGPSYRSAMDNKDFFIDRIDPKQYRATIAWLDRIYNRRLRKKLPHFVLLAEYTEHVEQAHKKLASLRGGDAPNAWIANDPREQAMLWQIRRASYSLSRFAEPTKRPAAFLEDMVVPPEKLGALFRSIQSLFTKYDIQAFVHGHGGDGHLHFYPLLDFTDPRTATTIPRMAQDFFEVATQLGGNICGEHNDGIIRTPYLDHVFEPAMLEVFEKLEALFDPQDVCNPGKKVNPRFSFTEVMRHNNN